MLNVWTLLVICCGTYIALFYHFGGGHFTNH